MKQQTVIVNPMNVPKEHLDRQIETTTAVKNLLDMIDASDDDRIAVGLSLLANAIYAYPANLRRAAYLRFGEMLRQGIEATELAEQADKDGGHAHEG
jgi:hypothetical protein